MLVFIFSFCFLQIAKNNSFKDTHRGKVLSHKLPELRKSTNMGVWAVGTLNQLFTRGS